MSEFIGARISLVSKSDIRYVGTLVDISAEASTVALENVTSFGTEGRAKRPEDEIPKSDNTYEYIVFRGSDVKDLKVEEPAKKAKENEPPAPPNDPAIMGATRPPAQQQAQGNAAPPPPGPQPGNMPPGGPGPNDQFPPHPPHFYGPPQGWGRGGPMPPPGPGGPPGPPPPGGYPPFGAPPGWGYYPPGPGFPPPPPGGFQYGPYGPYPPGPHGPPGPPPPGAPGHQQSPAGSAQELASPPTVKMPPSAPSGNNAPEQTTQTTRAPAPPTGPSNRSAPTGPSSNAASKAMSPAEAKGGKVIPAVPMAGAPKAQAKPGRSTALEDATQAATAAVAAAMAKLPPVSGQSQQNGRRPQQSTKESDDNLSKRVNEMRINDGTVRAPRNPGGSGFAARGGGAPRGRDGVRREPRKVEVPKDDFDFESSNAKFNKQDLVKEAIATEEVQEAHASPSEDEPEKPKQAGSYNKTSSFFDDLSSDSKDRTEGYQRPTGREWRGQEQKRNVETFGQGSIDYRGGYRGRGRGGRGGGRGRGSYGNGQPIQQGRRRGGYGAGELQ